MPCKTSTQNCDELKPTSYHKGSHAKVKKYVETASMAIKVEKVPRPGGCEYRHQKTLPSRSLYAQTECIQLPQSDLTTTTTKNRTNAKSEKMVFLKLSSQIFGADFFGEGVHSFF